MKGGTGKTATTHALGDALAGRGWRVLLVDADPQGSLTQAAGAGDADQTLRDVIGGAERGDLDLRSVLVDVGERLTLAPADVTLARSELELIGRIGRENVLAKALATVDGRFDVALIDCPPSLSLLTVNALNAAGGLIIPTQPQIADLRGLKMFLDTVDKIRADLNPDLELIGVLATFYDSRTLHHGEALDVMEGGGLPLLPMRVSRSIRVAESAAAGESIITYESGHKIAAAYRELAEYIEPWLRNERK